MGICFIEKYSSCCSIDIQCGIYVGFTTIVGIIVGFNVIEINEDPNSFYCDSIRRFFF